MRSHTPKNAQPHFATTQKTSYNSRRNERVEVSTFTKVKCPLLHEL